MARNLSPGVHNIRIKKPGGGTRMQRVKVLKSGKFKFIKNVKGGAKPMAKKAAKPRGKKGRTSPGRRKTMARRKMSLPNRIANALLFILALATPIQILIGPGTTAQKTNNLLLHATAGLAGTGGGKFNKEMAIAMYGPVAAAFILFEVKKMAMKKFRF